MKHSTRPPVERRVDESDRGYRTGRGHEPYPSPPVKPFSEVVWPHGPECLLKGWGTVTLWLSPFTGPTSRTLRLVHRDRVVQTHSVQTRNKTPDSPTTSFPSLVSVLTQVTCYPLPDHPRPRDLVRSKRFVLTTDV